MSLPADPSVPAAAQSPDPTAAFQAQSDAIAASILAKLGENPATATPAYAAPEAPVALQTPAPDPVVSAPAPEPPKPDATVEKLLARLADIEAKVSAERRSEPQQPQVPAVDPHAVYLNPEEHLGKLGIDVGLLTRQLVARALGEDASVEMRQHLAVAGQFQGVQKTISDMQATIERLQQENRMASLQNEIQTIATGIDGSKFPAVAAVARANGPWVQQALREVAVAGKITPADALARLEQRLSPLQAAFTPAATPPATAAPAATPTAAPAPTASSLGGAPSPAAPVALTWEQKTDAILAEVMKKHGL